MTCVAPYLKQVQSFYEMDERKKIQHKQQKNKKMKSQMDKTKAETAVRRNDGSDEKRNSSAQNSFSKLNQSKKPSLTQNVEHQQASDYNQETFNTYQDGKLLGFTTNDDQNSTKLPLINKTQTERSDMRNVAQQIDLKKKHVFLSSNRNQSLDLTSKKKSMKNQSFESDLPKIQRSNNKVTESLDLNQTFKKNSNYNLHSYKQNRSPNSQQHFPDAMFLVNKFEPEVMGWQNKLQIQNQLGQIEIILQDKQIKQTESTNVQQQQQISRNQPILAQSQQDKSSLKHVSVLTTPRTAQRQVKVYSPIPHALLNQNSQEEVQHLDNQHSLSPAKDKSNKKQSENEMKKKMVFVRERDLLRDWIRRNVVEKEVVATPTGQTHKLLKERKLIMENQQVEVAQQDTKNNKVIKINDNIPDMIVYQNNARDLYFKHACERRAAKEGLWVQNHIQASYFYRVKWDYCDANFDYGRQQPHQFFNHFPDTRELTTKQGLNKNLNNITEPGTDVASFYPRCYDLSVPKQLDLFIQDYNQTSILNIIAKHALYFQLIVSEQPEPISSHFNKFLAVGTKDQTVHFNSFRQAKNIKRELQSRFFARCTQENFGSININLLQLALYYCQDLLNKTVGFDKLNNPDLCDEFFKRNCFLPEYKLSDYQLEMLHLYGQVNLPARRDQLNKQELSRLRRVKGWTPVLNVGQSQMFQIDMYLVFITMKMHLQLQLHWPQYKTVNGTNNVWICKPCYNSRGLGIFCFNKKIDIINTFSKKAPAPKVVQKYIEKPLLLRGLTANKNELRKFDIRQWVLVTSIEPLQVYVYKDAYLRICGSHYDIEQFDDHLRHLSNFSIQKKEAAAQAASLQHATPEQNGQETEQQDEEQLQQQQSLNEFVMSTQQLFSKLTNANQYPEYSGQKISWKDTIYPQIKDITKKVFSKMTEVIEHHSNNFELFGLDFVIDEQLKCWLIEANMSPACAPRKGQQWLNDMVQDMADGMVNIIERKIMTNMLSHKIEYNGPVVDKLQKLKTNTLELDLKQWELIDFKSTFAVNVEPSLESSHQRQRNKLNQALQERKAFVKQGTKITSSSQKPLVFGPPQNPFDNLEVRGHAIDLKHERKMHRRYMKTMASLFIQRVWRGYKARVFIKQHQTRTIVKVKRNAGATALWKILVQKFGQTQSQDAEKRETFELIRKNCWLKRISSNEQYLKKLVFLQGKVRSFNKLKAMYKTAKQWDFKQQRLATSNSVDRNSKVTMLVQPSLEDNDQPSNQLEDALIDQLVEHHVPKFQSVRNNITSVDPNMLLNYQNIGINLNLPTDGRYFHFQGGMRMRRTNSENPVAYDDLLEKAAVNQEMGILMQNTASKISPYLQRTMPKKSTFDIYTENQRMTQASGFKPLKNAKQTGCHFENKKASCTQIGFGSLQASEKKKSSATKNFSNKAINQRINEGLRDPVPASLIDRLSQNKKQQASVFNHPNNSQNKPKFNTAMWNLFKQNQGNQPIHSPYLLNQLHNFSIRKNSLESVGDVESNQSQSKPKLKVSTKRNNLTDSSEVINQQRIVNGTMLPLQALSPADHVKKMMFQPQTSTQDAFFKKRTNMQHQNQPQKNIKADRVPFISQVGLNLRQIQVNSSVVQGRQSINKTANSDVAGVYQNNQVMSLDRLLSEVNESHNESGTQSINKIGRSFQNQSSQKSLKKEGEKKSVLNTVYKMRSVVARKDSQSVKNKFTDQQQATNWLNQN